MPRNNQYLIISQSGRALAASAKRAEINAHVIDLFADEDTVETTLSIHCVTGFSGRNDSEILINIVAEYESNDTNLSVIIGSGFEECPESLLQLEQRFSVIGNPSDVVRQLKNPRIFFSKLEELALPYPEYFIDITEPPNGKFLIKTIGGAGGGHVRHYKNDVSLTPKNYLQAFLGGKNYSATFIADGESFHVLGFNETWACQGNGDFIFAGAISNVSLPVELRQQITAAVKKLVAVFKIKGLCSLDFIVQKIGQYSILEVNPRPTASFELYENERNLFSQHIAAFQGKMTKPELDQNRSRGLGLLYAEKSITMPRLDWPEWVTDRPKMGKPITKGEPVCTVHAEGLDVENVKQQLNTRLAILRNHLDLQSEVA